MSSTIEISRICSFCGNTYTARTTTTKYCSLKCSQRGYKQRKREENIGKSNLETAKMAQTIQKPIEQLNAKVYLSVGEATQLMGISKNTLYRLIKRAELKIGKFGNHTVIKRTDIDLLFEKEFSMPAPIEKAPITEFYTIKEAEAKFDVKYGFLNNLIKRLKIPKTSHNGITYISKTHIDKYFNSKADEVASITEWYSVAEIQQKYSFTPDQIYGKVYDYNIPKLRLGRYVKISKLHFDDCLKIRI